MSEDEQVIPDAEIEYVCPKCETPLKVTQVSSTTISFEGRCECGVQDE